MAARLRARGRRASRDCGPVADRGGGRTRGDDLPRRRAHRRVANGRSPPRSWSRIRAGRSTRACAGTGPRPYAPADRGESPGRRRAGARWPAADPALWLLAAALGSAPWRRWGCALARRTRGAWPSPASAARGRTTHELQPTEPRSPDVGRFAPGSCWAIRSQTSEPPLIAMAQARPAPRRGPDRRGAGARAPLRVFVHHAAARRRRCRSRAAARRRSPPGPAPVCRGQGGAVPDRDQPACATSSRTTAPARPGW